MALGEYVAFAHGTPCHADQDPNQSGYLVMGAVEEDVNWYPEEVFERTFVKVGEGQSSLESRIDYLELRVNSIADVVAGSFSKWHRPTNPSAPPHIAPSNEPPAK